MTHNLQMLTHRRENIQDLNNKDWIALRSKIKHRTKTTLSTPKKIKDKVLRDTLKNLQWFAVEIT